MSRIKICETATTDTCTFKATSVLCNMPQAVAECFLCGRPLSDFWAARVFWGRWFVSTKKYQFEIYCVNKHILPRQWGKKVNSKIIIAQLWLNEDFTTACHLVLEMQTDTESNDFSPVLFRNDKYVLAHMQQETGRRHFWS